MVGTGCSQDRWCSFHVLFPESCVDKAYSLFFVVGTLGAMQVSCSRGGTITMVGLRRKYGNGWQWNIGTSSFLMDVGIPSKNAMT